MSDRRGTLVATAIALGAAAPLAGSPYRAHHGQVDVSALARLVVRQDDHVDALELAEWIRARRPGLRILDLRPPEAFDALHIPGAENVAIDALATLGLRPDETVVLYSEGGAHAAQAWVFLHALGHDRAWFLAAGIHEWVADVLEPVLAVDATEREQERFERAAELSRYFGGSPRRGVPRSAAASRAIELRRRGC